MICCTDWDITTCIRTKLNIVTEYIKEKNSNIIKVFGRYNFIGKISNALVILGYQ